MTIILELTQREAEALARLTMAAVEWSVSGDFGADVRAISNALFDVGIREAPYGVKVPHEEGARWPRDREWQHV